MAPKEVSKVVRLGSDFSGLECLSWATGCLGIATGKNLHRFDTYSLAIAFMLSSFQEMWLQAQAMFHERAGP